MRKHGTSALFVNELKITKTIQKALTRRDQEPVNLHQRQNILKMPFLSSDKKTTG